MAQAGISTLECRLQQSTTVRTAVKTGTYATCRENKETMASIASKPDPKRTSASCARMNLKSEGDSYVAILPDKTIAIIALESREAYTGTF
jgi:hypothetical protein